MFKFISRLLNKVSAARDKVISGKSEHWRRVKGGTLMHIPKGAATPPAIISAIPANADALSMATDALNICLSKQVDILGATFKIGLRPNPWIDFIYGSSTYGIAHIIQERQSYIDRWRLAFPGEPCPFPTPTDVLAHIPETLINGKVISIRGEIDYQDWRVVVEAHRPTAITTAYKNTKEVRDAKNKLEAKESKNL